jgi:hypothetical protein
MGAGGSQACKAGHLTESAAEVAEGRTVRRKGSGNLEAGCEGPWTQQADQGPG